MFVGVVMHHIGAYPLLSAYCRSVYHYKCMRLFQSIRYISNSNITLKFTHQLTDDKFVSVGIDGDVCIEAELNNFGVVYIFNQCIKCSTCKKGQACLHVQHILSLLKSAEDGINELHPVLQLLSDQLSTEKSVPTCSSSLMCLSNTPIPFEVPSHLKHVFRQTPENRFGIHNGVANLIPDSTSLLQVCPSCQLQNWCEEPSLTCSSTLLTLLNHYPAKGLLLTLHLD